MTIRWNGICPEANSVPPGERKTIQGEEKMSIAKSLERSAANLALLRERGNGDLEKMIPAIVEDIRFDAERVRGLEGIAAISEDIVKAFQEQEAAR
jgi:hypothetical protein